MDGVEIKIREIVHDIAGLDPNARGTLISTWTLALPPSMLCSC